MERLARSMYELLACSRYTAVQAAATRAFQTCTAGSPPPAQGRWARRHQGQVNDQRGLLRRSDQQRGRPTAGHPSPGSRYVDERGKIVMN